VKERRERWATDRPDLPSENLVFIDESGAQTNLVRRRGRCAAGERLVAAVPHGHWKTTTMISAVRLSGACASVILDGPVDADAFRTYVRWSLAPALGEGDIVIMDNLQSHKASGVKEMIEAAGATVRYLPPYSPDLNPIENMWSKVKENLRSAAARSFDALQQAVWSALDRVTPGDCAGFFRHCGYAAT
jgi:transposase